MSGPGRFFGPADPAGSGREFSLIEALFEPSRLTRDGRGPGDDGYLLETGGETWAVSLDCSVEGVHYRLDWASPEEALEKAFLSNLSDINAMGGRASLAFLGLGASRGWDEAMFRRLGEAMRRLEAKHGFRVAGGDTVFKAGESFFSVTVMGRVTGKPLLRSAARPGQRIYVSGSLGASAAGLSLLRQGLRPRGAGEACVRAHLLPEPPLDLGPFLAGLPGPAAAIDISDGLSSELWHLARASGCRLRVEWGKLPYDPALGRLPGGADFRAWVLHGGEEYQLLFTGDFSAAEAEELRARFRVTEIGTVVEGEGVGILDGAGRETELEAEGWSH